jgi:hypothetical protein
MTEEIPNSEVRVREFLTSFYEKMEAPLIEGRTLAFYVDEIQPYSQPHKPKRQDIILSMVIDEYLGFMIACHARLAETLGRNQDQGAVCALTQLSMIMNDIAAIRLLTSRGFDLAARRQSRSLYETVNTFILSSHDEEFRKAFLASTTFEASNKFWHTYIAKEKDLRRIKDRFPEQFGNPEFLNDVMVEERKILGMTVHPSMLLGLALLKREVNRFSLSDDRDTQYSSEKVLQFTMFQCWNAVTFGLGHLGLKPVPLFEAMLQDTEASPGSVVWRSLPAWRKALMMLCPVIAVRITDMRREAATRSKASDEKAASEREGDH